MDSIELPEKVVNVDTRDNMERKKYRVSRWSGNTQVELYSNFVEYYEEYLDPKDIEIARLKRELEKYKAQVPKKKRRIITEGERKEIKELILKGEGNRPLAKSIKLARQ